MILKNIAIKDRSFNPAEAEEGFRRVAMMILIILIENVSIQPKPKKGLEANNFS